jgi:hypothetical protein
LKHFSFRFLPAAALLLYSCSTYAAEVEIQGSEQFLAQVRQALHLLKERDASAYAIVSSYVGLIQEGERSGMWAYKTPPTYVMSRDTAMSSLTWAAATIAHDSCHSQLYHEYRKAHAGPVPNSVWTGTVAEQQCMRHQILVMEHIGASEREIEYARTQADGAYVKDKESWGEYYSNRKW